MNFKQIKKSFLCSALVLCLAFTAAGCNKKQDWRMIYEIDSEPKVLDPQIAADDASQLVIGNVFEGLVRLDQNGAIQPACAVNYTVSGDGLAYTFTLRDGAKWSDGVEVKAADFVYALRRVVNPVTHSPYASLLFSVAGARDIYQGGADPGTLGASAPDDKTLVITLTQPTDSFLQSLTMTFAVPCREDFFLSTSAKYGLDKAMVVSNGPYAVSGWSHGSSLSLKANPYYHTASKTGPTAVTCKITAPDGDRDKRLLDANTDACSIQPGTAQSDQKKLRITGFADTVWVLSLNTQDAQLSNGNLRQALMRSIDHAAYSSSLSPWLSVADYFIPPAVTVGGQPFSGINLPASSYYQPDQAKELLRQAKVELGLKATQMPSVTVIYPSDQYHVLVAGSLMKMWQDRLGIYVNFTPLAPADYQARVAAKNYQAAILSYKPDYNAPESAFHAFQNAAVPSSMVFDGDAGAAFSDTVAAAMYSADAQSKADACSRAQGMILDTFAAYPLYYQTQYYAQSGKISGVEFHPFGTRAYFFHAAFKK